MPSLLHELLRSLFQNRPELAPALLDEALGLKLPNYASVRIESADFSQIIPAEYRADLVVLLVDSKPVLAVIVEVQLAVDERKRFTWPAYAACLRARFECPALVLVVTADQAVAHWASAPIAIGPASTFTPWVMGPQAVPVITDPQRAIADPELGVLSVMAHGREDVETAVKIAVAARAGVATITDRDLYVLYNDVILAHLSEAARKALEMLPQGYQFQDPLIRESVEKGRDEGRVEGRVEGQREIVLRQLSKRFGPLPGWAEERIAQATTEQLDLYADAVLTAVSLEEVLQLNA